MGGDGLDGNGKWDIERGGCVATAWRGREIGDNRGRRRGSDELISNGQSGVFLSNHAMALVEWSLLTRKSSPVYSEKSESVSEVRGGGMWCRQVERKLIRMFRPAAE